MSETGTKEGKIEECKGRPMRQLILVASIAAGIQFGWALQLSLLTPYVQLLGISHTWAPFIWLCGPISGMIVQPTVGYYSDRSTSRFGRRRPYIAIGAALVSVAVFLIGYAADIGRSSGDPSSPTSVKPRAIGVFVVGFWVLDVANNMLQGPCRALLADLAAGDQSKTRTSFAFYTFFMAVGSVLGYAAGSYSRLHRIFPFTRTDACDDYCANLKSCFFISVALLLSLTILALSLISEIPYVLPEPDSISTNSKLVSEPDSISTKSKPMASKTLPFFGEMFEAIKGLSKAMWVLLLVTCLNWIAWFPFLLFDTDWMGKEVYGGKVGEGRNYSLGVRAGALGLMLNSVVAGVASLGIETLARWLGGAKRLWGIVNLVLAVCLAMTVVVTKMAESARHDMAATGAMEVALPPLHVKVAALALFSLLGVPFAVTCSIPFALASIFSTSSGVGQGLALGILNLAIVIPQMFVSITSGPWDDIFGGGNLPAFVVGAIAATASAILAFTVLPSPPPEAKIDATTSAAH